MCIRDSEQTGRLPEREPVLVDGGIGVYATEAYAATLKAAAPSQTLAGYLRAHLDQIDVYKRQVLTLASSLSTQMTRWPISAKQTVATSPTYPDPITQIETGFDILWRYLLGGFPRELAARKISGR